MNDKNLDGPLSGMRVIELAHIMAGPVCGMMLADMGADVIKVEKPVGDDSRRILPPSINGESAAFMMMNRNKRGIALDLKHPDGKAVLNKLLETADVLIENYRKGTMEKLGFGYEEISKTYPKIIYCEISGFGRTGPYAQRGGFDLIAQGMSGLMSITGEGSGRPPVKTGAPVSDITAGILSAMGISAAYSNVLKTGVGQKVDTSLLEAAITQTYWQSAIAFATGTAPEPLGSAHPLNAPYQSFRTSDGWINIGAANQRNWLKLLKALDSPELGEDPRFSENLDRMENVKVLEEILSKKMEMKSTEFWLKRLDEFDVPAGPVLNIPEMHIDPQVQARNMVVELSHPVAGDVKAIGHPIKYSKTPAKVKRPAPTLGQHSREILAEIGYDESTISKFLSSGGVIST